MDTWFKCFHKLKDSVAFKNSYLLHVWIWCLLSAKYFKCSTVFYSGQRSESVDLLPGQFVFVRKKAAEELNMTESGFYKRLKKLEKLKNINIESNNRFTKITVINWDIYQGSTEKSNTDCNNRVTTVEQQSNTINRYNIESIDINPPLIPPQEKKSEKPKRKKRVSELTKNQLESFAKFWSVWPKRVAQADAEKAWMKISPTNGQVEIICHAVEKWKQSPKWQENNGEFIPYPATWLNGKRWRDEISTIKHQPASTSPIITAGDKSIFADPE